MGPQEFEDSSLEEQVVVAPGSTPYGTPAPSSQEDRRIADAAGAKSWQREHSPFRFSKRPFIITAAAIVGILLVFVIGAKLFGSNSAKDKKQNAYANQTVDTQTTKGYEDLLAGNTSLQVNGQLQVTNGVVLEPSNAPAKPKTGQLYYDSKTKQPYYYDGSKFVSFAPTTIPTHVTAIGGVSGDISVGNGLQITSNGQLSLSASTLASIANSKSTIVWTDLSGYPVACANGEAITKLADVPTCTAFLSGATADASYIKLQSTTPGTAQTGNLNISGTAIAGLFSGNGSGLTNLNANNISAGTVASGRLTGNYSGITGVGTLTVGTWNASTITVPYGGTGQTSFTSNGVIYGNGAGALGATAAGNTGDCLVANTGSAPTWESCVAAAGSGVTSVNTLDGDLIIQGTGGQVAVNDNGSDTLTVSLDASVSLLGQTIGLSELELGSVDSSKIVNGTIVNADLQAGTFSNITGVGTIVAGTWNATSLSDAYIDNNITIDATGSVNWSALTGYPAACAAGEAISTLADTPTCTAFLTGSAANGAYIQLQVTTPGTAQTGNLNISGTAIAGSFSGNGSGLTSLNANNISSGTLNNSRLDPAVSLLGQTIALGTETVGNYQLFTTAGDGISVTGSAGVGTNPTIAVDSTVCRTSGNCAGNGNGGGASNSGTQNYLTKTDNNGNLVDSLIYDDGSALGVGTATPGYLVDVQGGAGVVARFSGRVIGADAVNGNEFVTKDQLDSAVGGVGAGVSSINTLDGALSIQGTAGQIGVGDNGSDTIILTLDASVSLLGQTIESSEITNGTITGTDIANGTVTGSNIASSTITNSNLQAGSYTNITGVGTVIAGTWQATTVGVGYGGTGQTSFTANGVLYGNGGGGLGVTAAGSDGECLVGHTGSAPTWDDCVAAGGGSGVTSLNTLDGGLTLQGTAGKIDVSDNGSNTITLDLDASVSLLGQTIEGSEITNGTVTGTDIANSTITNTNLQAGSYTNITGVGTLTVGTWNATSISDANVDNNLTISSSGTVDWQALNNYPVACGAGTAITQLGDSVTCTAFAAGSGSGNYIQNQNASQQASSNFWISGVGRADTALRTPALRAATDSTTGIQIQNAAGGTNIMTIDTTNARVGIGTTPSYKLHVTDTSAATAGINFGTYLGFTASPASAPGGPTSYIATNNQAQTSSTNVNANTALWGSRGIAINQGAGTLGVALGTNGTAENAAAGSITTAIGIQGAIINSGAGNIGLGVALGASSPLVSAGSITSAYGLYVDSQKVSGVGTGYGIYQVGATDINNFAGNVAIGSLSAPTAALDVTGSGKFSTSVLTPTVDTASATTLNVGTSTASAITIGRSGITTTIASGSNFATAKGADYSTITGTDVALSGTLFRMTGVSAQTLNSIVGSAANDGRRITLLNVSGFTATVSNNGAGSAGNKIITGAGTDIQLPNGASVDLIYDWSGSAATSFWRVNSGVSSVCSTCANTSLSNLTSVSINAALGVGTSNSYDLGASGASFRTLYAGTSVLTPAVDTISAGTLTVGASTASAITIGKSASNVTTTIQGNTLIKPTTGNDSSTLFQIQNAAGTTTFFTADSSTNSATTIRIGTASDNMTISSYTNGGANGAYEPLLNGTARHAKSIVLAAEYPGAVLDYASDTVCNNGGSPIINGTMTSGYSGDTSPRQNYFNWVAGSGQTNQCYDVVVQVPIPKDFSAWAASNPWSMYVYNSAGTNSTSVYVNAIDTANTVDTAYGGYVAVSSGTTLASANLTTPTGTYTAGGYMTLKIRMYSASSTTNVRIGNITLNYLSKY